MEYMKPDLVLSVWERNHVFAPAFTDEDMDELVNICDHVVFNSVSQLKKHKARCIEGGVSFGLRVNPEFLHRVTMQYMTHARRAADLELLLRI